MKYVTAAVVVTVATLSGVDLHAGVASKCSLHLTELAGRHKSVGQTVLSNSTRKDEKFLTHLLALVYTESRFFPWATSHAGAHGLTQITDAAVVDAAKHCNLPVRRAIELTEPSINVRYGSCYLDLLLSQVDEDWTRALIAYNGGYRQLTRYERNETLASETANYVLKIRRLQQECIK